MELERERSARAKAERAAEGWAAKADASRRETVTVTDEFQRKLDASHTRELEIQARLAAATAELVQERTMRQAAQSAAQALESDARAAREQATTLHQALERLSGILATSASSTSKQTVRRKRSVPAASRDWLRLRQPMFRDRPTPRGATRGREGRATNTLLRIGCGAARLRGHPSGIDKRGLKALVLRLAGQPCADVMATTVAHCQQGQWRSNCAASS